MSTHLQLIALVEGNLAGTAALRPISERSCEAKRLYVRPLYRGRGVGRALLARLVQDARAEGYQEMHADTLESMEAAQGLYTRMGFSTVGPYSSHPTPRGYFSEALALSDERWRRRTERG